MKKLESDVMARFKRMAGYDVCFQMGVDEHSLNVAKQAESQKLDTKEYCDGMAVQFEKVWKYLDIQYDRFIRTTDDDHLVSVQEMFKRIYDNGDIYTGKYSGYYCVSCEKYLSGKRTEKTGCALFHKREPKWLEERKLFFLVI